MTEPDSDPHSWHVGPRVPNYKSVTLREGDRFADRYLVRATLGQGGMGVVYRAFDETSDREVALKLLLGRISPERRERLNREGALTASLRHAGIVRIHTAGEEDGVPYLVYELVEGKSLSWGDLDTLDRPARLAILLEVAEAVAHAHTQGVVHRDLKPDNVLLDAEGRARVTDFGLAWHGDLERITVSGAVIGTPQYMAPEQAAGDVQAIGEPADVWALGVMLYRALTGELPFEAGTLIELQARILQSAPVPPRELAPDVPEDLETVCLTCLAKEPRDRYPNAGALAADLTHALASRPISVRPRSPWRRSAVRRGVALALGAAVVLGLALALLVFRLTRVGEAELRALVAQVHQGGSLELLEQALGELEEDVDPALRSRAHLLLAFAPADSPRTWGSRLEHARRARALQEDVGSAELAAGRALLGLDRFGEAALAFGRAQAAGESVEGAQGQARALVEAGDFEAAEGLVGELASSRVRARLLEVLVPALLDAGQATRAQRLLEASAEPSVAVLRLQADVAAAGGGDRLAPLERALQRWSGHPAPFLALAYAYLEQGEVEAAWSTTRRALRSGLVAGELVRLARALRGLLATPAELGTIRDEQSGWRDGATRWWLTKGERDLAYLEHAAMPAALELDGALPAERRRRRARQAGELALELALDPALTSRARALLGHLESAAGVPAQQAPLDEALRAEAAELYDRCRDGLRSKSGDVAGMRASLERVVELDPLHPDARYYLGLVKTLAGARREGLIECLGAASRNPDLLHRLVKLVDSRGQVPFIAEQDAPPADDRLLSALLACVEIEHEGRLDLIEPTLHELSEILRDDPAETVAWTLRGFVHLRVGRLAQAERDLRVAEEAAPGCAQARFYQALLLAARGANAEAVLTVLRHAQGLGFNQWRRPQWQASAYPVVEPYRQEPGFELFFNAKTLDGTPLPLGRAPQGAFLEITGEVATGWALDPDGSGPVTVRFYADGPPRVGDSLGEVRADRPHPAAGASGDHGFRFELPAAARGRLVYAVAVDLERRRRSVVLGGAPRLALAP